MDQTSPPATTPDDTADVLIVGAGISGLAAAWRWQTAGQRVVVLDTARQPGGVIGTVERQGFRFEIGPNTVQRSTELEALCRAAGCADQLVAPNTDARRRLVMHGGGLVAAPGTPPAILTTPLLSRSARVRLLTEPWRRRGPGPEESVSAFVTRRLGPGAAHLADAMVLGVFAGDPAALAVGYAFPRMYALEQQYGSVLRGLRARGRGAALPLVGFEGGFAALVAHLRQGLDVRTGHSVREIQTVTDGFQATVAGDGGHRRWTARRLATAVPAATTARLLTPLGATAPFAAIPHAPVAVVGLGWARAQVDHPLDAFGFLVPHREAQPILGCLFPSTLFPSAAPDDGVVLTVMIGGARQPELVEHDDAVLVRTAVDALRPLLGLRGAPRVHHVARWRPGIPQATSAVAAARTTAERLERHHPGLEILGGWLRGVGVPDCVRAGWTGRPDLSR